MSETANQQEQKRKTTPEIAAAAELDDAAKKLAASSKSPREFVDELVKQGKFGDAVKFIAHSLPKREGVWWAWSCAKKSVDDPPPKPIQGALEATEKWISQPNDENARAARERGVEAQTDNPAGCAAMAAFFGGSSLAPPDCPPVPPGEYLTAKAVGASVVLAAAAKEPERVEERYKAFITQGAEVAHRIGIWERPPRKE